MKKSRFLCLLPLIFSFALTSCDLMSMMTPSAKKRSSREDNESSETVIESERSNKPFSSSRHSHYVSDNSSWYIDTNFHWQECDLGDGGIVNRGIHNWIEVERVEPTCTEAGFSRRRCSVCGYDKVEQLPALGHEWQQIPVEEDYEYIAPTIDSEGRMTERCLRCQQTQIVAIPKITKTFRVGSVYAENDYNTGVVDVLFYGYQQGYSFDDFKIAIGLKDSSGNFVLGSANPQDEEYCYAPISYVLDDGMFYTVIHLTDLAKKSILSIGTYQFYAGPKGCYGPAVVDSKSGEYRYDDYFSYGFDINYEIGSVLELHCEPITRHFRLSDAKIEYLNNGNEAWLKIFCVSDKTQTTESRLQTFLNSLSPYVDFMEIGGAWNQTILNSDDYYYEVKTENYQLNVYFCVNISFMLSKSVNKYITHINFVNSDITDCKMDESFTHTYTIPNSNKKFELISMPGATSQNEFWGCLGINIIE